MNRLSRMLLLVISMGMVSSMAWAQSGSIPLKVVTPQRLNLGGTWQFRFDPEDAGQTERWFEPRVDEEGWMTTEVPGTFNLIGEDNYWYQGNGWYRTTFKIPGNWPLDQRMILRFHGVAIRSKIWVNGKPAGEHLFPYTPFELDVTDLVNPRGENSLVVKADNRILEFAIPDSRWDGWWFYGGITRDVFLEHRPKTSIEKTWLNTWRNETQGWDVEATAVVHKTAGSDRMETLTFLLQDAQGKEIWSKTVDLDIRPGSTEVSVRALIESAKPWSPESPVLYQLKAQLNGESPHSRSIRTAFREIEVDGSRVLLNGEPIVIHGTSRHEDHPEYGSTIPLERTRKDLEEIKELGCNFVRTAHYTQDPAFYDLCDEMGLLVWTEIPAWKTRPEVLADGEVYKTYAKPQLAEMIHEYRHHPCVVIWSIGNEFDSKKEAAAWYVKNACDYVRSLDPTRLVTFASDRREEDICFPYVDIISINEYYGWYYGTIYDIGGVLDVLHEMHPDKPILVSEFGSGTPLDVRGTNKFRISHKGYNMDYQLKFLQAHLEQIFFYKRRGYVAGGLQWVYNDFADPHRVGGGHPEEWAYVNLKGVVTQKRKRKPSFDLLKEFFQYVQQNPRE